MTLTQMAMTGLALVVVLLIVVAARLRGQLTQLSQQVGDLRSGPAPSPPTPPSLPVTPVAPVPIAEKSAAQPPAEQPVSHQSDERDEDVSVITRLDGDPDPDLTTARIASVTLGGPLIKVAALSHGVRRALREEHRMRIAYVVRKEMRRQRKMRRRGRAERAPSQRWRP